MINSNLINKVHLGDCISFMNTLPNESIDLIVTDPPYGMSYVMNHISIKHDAIAGDDFEDTKILLEKYFNECFRIMKPNTAIYSFCSWHKVGWFQQEMEKHFQLKNLIVWNKNTHGVGDLKGSYGPKHELVWFAHKGRSLLRGNRPVDVIDCVKENSIEIGHPCLTPGELVLTDDGFRIIDDLKIGDLVYSENGKFNKITEKYSWPCKDYVYKIKVEGTNKTTTATGNHPFFVWRLENKSKLDMGTANWVNAENIQLNDYILTPVSTFSEINNGKSDIWWWTAGLWLAEGSILSNEKTRKKPNIYPSFSLNIEEMDFVEKIKQEFPNVGVYPRKEIGRENSMEVVIFEKDLADQFIKLCGRAKNKKISIDVLSATKNQKQSFLNGFIAGDGCMVRGKYQIKTSSKKIASLLPLLAESIGMRMSVYEFDDSNRNVFINGRKIKTGIYYSLYLDKINSKKNKIRFITHNNKLYSLRKVKEIQKITYDNIVYNISVDESETFQTCVGMSHNTPKPVDLLKIFIEASSNENDIIFDGFSGSGSTGVAAIQSNRLFIGSELEEKYHSIAQKRIDDEIYAMNNMNSLFEF